MQKNPIRFAHLIPIPAHIQHPDHYKKWIIVRNTFVIFLVSGIWHGANWTFLAWGTYHAILFLPLILLGKNRKYTNQVAAYTDSTGKEHLRILPTWREALQMIVTFAFVVMGWIIFRATGMPSLFHYLEGMCDVSLFSIPQGGSTKRIPLVICIVVMLIIEWFQRNKQHGLEMNINKWYVRYAIYMIIVAAIIYFFADAVTFIYFQF